MEELQKLIGCKVHVYVYLYARLLVKMTGELRENSDGQLWVQCHSNHSNSLYIHEGAFEIDMEKADKKIIRLFKG